MLSDYVRSLIVVYPVTFLTGYAMYFPFPYMPELTRWLGYREENTGYYVSVVVAVYHLGGILTNYYMGLLSDKYGYKKTLIVFLIAKCVINLILGFCRDIYSIIILRFLAGVCSVTMSTCRAILGVYCTEGRKAIDMVFYIAVFNLGYTTSLVIGGYLASPETKYPHTFTSTFFLIFPYVLPPLIASIGCAACVVLVFFMYPKNNPDGVNFGYQKMGYVKGNSGDLISDANHNESINETVELNDVSMKTNEETKAYNSVDIIKEIHTGTPICTGMNEHTNIETDTKRDNDRHEITDNTAQSPSNHTFIQLLKDTTILRVCSIYGLQCFSFYGYLEILAIWAATSINLGGLAYTTDQIGSITVITIVPYLVLQLFLVPFMQMKIGCRRSIVLCSLLGMIFLSLTPISQYIHTYSMQRLFLLSSNLIVSFCDAAICTAFFILLNDCIIDDQAGRLNGLGNMIGSIGRLLGPIFCGFIFPRSITSNVGSPIDSSLTFVFMGIVSWSISLISYTMPTSSH